MLAYRAYPDIHCPACNHHRKQRTASCKNQTLLVVRWLIDATPGPPPTAMLTKP